jgi:hypothetical protein
MNQGQLEVNYEQFFLTTVKERRNIFTEITAENRAFLVKTHAERWVAANRSRLNHEQVSVVEELTQSISPEWYKTKLDFSEKIDPKAEVLVKKIEAVLSREDVSQLATNNAEYIPVVEDENN